MEATAAALNAKRDKELFIWVEREEEIEGTQRDVPLIPCGSGRKNGGRAYGDESIRILLQSVK